MVIAYGNIEEIAVEVTVHVAPSMKEQVSEAVSPIILSCYTIW